MKVVHLVVGTVLAVAAVLTAPPAARRSRERGLSQSTETAVLIAGAVVIGGIIVTAITLFVKGKMPK